MIMADVNKHRADIQASHSVMIWRRRDWYLNVDEDFLKKSAYADKLSSKFAISPVSLLCQILGRIPPLLRGAKVGDECQMFY